MSEFKPEDQYKMKENPPQSWVLFGFVAMFAMFGIMFCWWAQQLTNNICANRANGTSPW